MRISQKKIGNFPVFKLIVILVLVVITVVGCYVSKGDISSKQLFTKNGGKYGLETSDAIYFSTIGTPLDNQSHSATYKLDKKSGEITVISDKSTYFIDGDIEYAYNTDLSNNILNRFNLNTYNWEIVGDADDYNKKVLVLDFTEPLQVEFETPLQGLNENSESQISRTYDIFEGWIYFSVDSFDFSGLFRSDLNGNSFEKVISGSSFAPESALIINNELYYIEDGKIICLNLNDKESKIIVNKNEISKLQFFDGKLYFIDNVASTLYKIDRSKIETVLSLEGIEDYLMTSEAIILWANSKLYRSNQNGNQIEAIDSVVNNNKQLENEHIKTYLDKISNQEDQLQNDLNLMAGGTCYLENGYLYYSTFYTDGVFKKDITTQETTRLLSGKASDIQILGEELYYLGIDENKQEVVGKINLTSGMTRTLFTGEISFLRNINDVIIFISQFKRGNFDGEVLTIISKEGSAPNRVALSTKSKQIIVNNNMIYLLQENTLWKFDLNLSTITKLIEGDIEKFAIADEILLYSSEKQGIFLKDLTVDETSHLLVDEKIKNGTFNIYANSIYYIGENSLLCRSNGEKSEILLSEEIDNFFIFKNLLFYEQSGEFKILDLN